MRSVLILHKLSVYDFKYLRWAFLKKETNFWLYLFFNWRLLTSYSLVRKREREWSQTKSYFPNTYNCQSWTTTNPKVTNSIQTSYGNDRVPNTHLLHLQFSGGNTCKELNSEIKLALKPRHWGMRCEYPKWGVFTIIPNNLDQFWFSHIFT